MMGVCFQICSWPVEVVVELGIEVVSLQVYHREDRRDRAGELPECVIYVLGLLRHTSAKRLIVCAGRTPNASAECLLARHYERAPC
jgi:hypothetical protein